MARAKSGACFTTSAIQKTISPEVEEREKLKMSVGFAFPRNSRFSFLISALPTKATLKSYFVPRTASLAERKNARGTRGLGCSICVTVTEDIAGYRRPRFFSTGSLPSFASFSRSALRSMYLRVAIFRLRVERLRVL